jgi:hypothetical protein
LPEAAAAMAVAARSSSAAQLRLENAPNPFRSATKIRFVLPAAAQVQMDVFDVTGRRVATPVDDAWSAAGLHEVAFVPAGLTSGVYVCRLQAGSEVTTRRMLVLQ